MSKANSPYLRNVQIMGKYESRKMLPRDRLIEKNEDSEVLLNLNQVKQGPSDMSL